MLKYKKTRAFLTLLLSVILLISFAGCDADGIEGGDMIMMPGVGDRCGLQIAGKAAEFTVPERKSAYYLSFNEVEKKIYNAAYTTVCANESSFKLTGVDLNAYSEVYAYTLTTFINDHPEFFWLDGYIEISTLRMSNSHLGNMEITFGVYDYWKNNDPDEAKRELDAALDVIVAEANTYPDDYSKIKFVHDYIITFNSYDFEAYELGEALDPEAAARVSSAYGGLVCGETMCAGYARAFDLVMHELGLDSLYITGTADGGSHAWNLIKLDGEYYHVDLTWDDPDEEGDVRLYNYFCVNDDMISKTHTVDEEYSYFKADGVKYNYHVYESLYLEKYDLEAVQKIFTSRPSELSISIRFKNEGAKKSAIDDLIENGKLYDIIDAIGKKSYSYIDNDSLPILTFIIE